MRLQKLVLHDFGAYRGRQELNFATEPGKPVVLVGALNGAGKTTLLDAFKLVLYGKRARCSNRGKLPYEDYLRACVNRRVRHTHGAGLELAFSYWREGVLHNIHLHRSWRQVGESMKEFLDVVHDGRSDRVMAEQWNDLVEDFLPLGLSDLFFFDGEKIEQLADPTSSRDLLRSAISALLGLDLVEQLAVDLIVVEKRNSEKLGTESEQKEEAELESVSASRRQALSEAESEAELVRAKQRAIQAELEQVEELITRHGGTLYEQRPQIERARSEAEQEIRHIDERFREVAGGVLPLSLVRGQLNEIALQAHAEQQAAFSSVVVETLEVRDRELEGVLSTFSPSARLAAAVQKHLQADRMRRATESAIDRYLAPTPELIAVLHGLLTEQLTEAETHATEIRNRRDDYTAILGGLERKLVGIPDSEEVRSLILRRADLRDKTMSAGAGVKAADAIVAERKRELDANEKRLLECRRDRVARQAGAAAAARVVHHSQRTRQTLEAFRVAALSHHVQRLAALIEETFKALMRKTTLVHRLQIDPGSCELRLFAGEDHLLESERLSAGERQLLAVAILWGLAKASGRPLPTIIDTPMARLDSKHREKLIHHYFPYASHQVLILSTDEEVNAFWYERLKPYVSRAYTLENDEADQRTLVVDGYLPQEFGR